MSFNNSFKNSFKNSFNALTHQGAVEELKQIEFKQNACGLSTNHGLEN